MDPYTWAYMAIMVISAYVSYKNRPKTTTPKPVAFQDFEFPQFSEGTPQCVFFGDCWTPDWMVLSYGNYRTTPIKTKGGKK
ncbi:hypothetical protein [Stutzerimonas nitrititolerans]|uniref:hypothetical protein n=1 Tax=Stutzerimonas nitrititolerans TaxID=2482751 RepID=UPI00289FA5FA|nr:hypothetical protein [Stutzerimonas nitrititolerans]